MCANWVSLRKSVVLLAPLLMRAVYRTSLPVRKVNTMIAAWGKIVKAPGQEFSNVRRKVQNGTSSKGGDSSYRSPSVREKRFAYSALVFLMSDLLSPRTAPYLQETLRKKSSCKSEKDVSPPRAFQNADELRRGRSISQ